MPETDDTDKIEDGQRIGMPKTELKQYQHKPTNRLYFLQSPIETVVAAAH